MPVIRSFGDRHYTQVSCTTKPFHPMVCPKQVIHPDNDEQIINSKMPRGDWEKEGQREGNRDGGKQ